MFVSKEELRYKITVLESKVKYLEDKLHDAKKAMSDVADAGIAGIEYVGAANYAERKREALDKLDRVYSEHFSNIFG